MPPTQVVLTPRRLDRFSSYSGIRLVDTVQLTHDELRAAGLDREAPMDLWKFPGVRIHFQSSFSADRLVGGEGKLIDLTREGCRVKSDRRVPPGTELELRINLPDHDLLIDVELAVVRWANQGEFGLEFVRMRSEAQELLHRVVQTRENDSLE